MNVLEELTDVSASGKNTLFLPSGLLGLERIKRFLLITNPGEEPFSWLQVVDAPDLAFVIVPGFLVRPDYAPDIPSEDVAFLEIYEPDDALIYNIVTIRSGGNSTVNLKGPVVVNKHTFRAKQVILANAADYSVKEPLPVLK